MGKSLCFGSGVSMRSKHTIRKARDGDLGPLGPAVNDIRSCQCGKRFINKETEDFRFCRRCRRNMERRSHVAVFAA